MSHANHHSLKRMFREFNMRDQSDGALLRAFGQTANQEAFAELMHRHGAMVQNAARSVLGNVPEAEDIAQATFLTLARKAASLGGLDVLGGWLYHVAICLARNARQKQQRRLAREKEAAMLDVPTDEAPAISDAALAALYEELDTLAATYREPVILHHLEGKSYEQAAVMLGCNTNTFASRLTRAREKLQKRLAGRGVALGATALVAGLSQSASAAELPAAVVSATCQAAGMLAAGTAVTGGVVSAHVTALTERAMKMLWIAKVKSVVLACVIAAVVAGVSVPVGMAVAGVVKGDAKPEAIAQPTTAAAGTNACCTSNNYELALQAAKAANTNTNSKQKTLLYTDAISRFSHIEASHPESTNAPSALFNIALAYERMNRIEEAIAGYETVLNRYPDKPVAAEALARMGQIWLNKGKAIESKSREESDPIKKEKLNLQQVEMYRTAAQQFARVNEQFPEHELAGKTKVLSGQCYMRAKDMDRAVDAFVAMAAEKTAAPEVIAEAMYWLGDCYAKSNKITQAYRTFQVLTWDYPETTWAKYARGRLSDPEFFATDGKDDASLTTGPTLAQPAAARPQTNASVAASNLPRQVPSTTMMPEDALLQTAQELRNVALWSKRLHCEPIPLPEAVAAYRKVAELHPNSAAARMAIFEIAELYESLGDQTQALALYQVIANTLPNTTEGGRAFEKIVGDHLDNRDFANALTMIEKYVADPNAFGRDSMLLKGCLAAYSIGDYAKAKALVEILIEECPESPHAKKGVQIRPKILERIGSSSRESIADNESKVTSKYATTTAAKVAEAQSAVEYAKQKEELAALNAAKIVEALSRITVKTISQVEAREILAAAKSFLRNKDKARAAERFSRILNHRSPDVAAEAQYWMAEIYRESQLITEAYKGYKKLTWDYPESTWATYARGRLASEKAFQEIEDPERKTHNSTTPQTANGVKSRIQYYFPDIADVSETP